MSHRKFLTVAEKELDHSLDRLFQACDLIYQNPSIEHYRKIISVLEELHAKHPDFKRDKVTNRLAATYLFFGMHLEKEGQLDEAIKYYRKTIKLRPGEMYTEDCLNRCKRKLESLGLRIFTDERPEHLQQLQRPEAERPEIKKQESRKPKGKVVSLGMASSIWDRPGLPKRPKINLWKEVPTKKGVGK